MIKSAIQTLITGRADGGDNPVSTERDLWTAVLNSCYNLAPKEVLSSATTYATPTNATNFPYQLLFNKQGGIITVTGHLRNATTGTVYGQTIAVITDPELKVSLVTLNGSVGFYTGIGRDFTNNTTIYFDIRDIAGVTTLRVRGDMPATTAGYEIISLTYNALN